MKLYTIVKLSAVRPMKATGKSVPSTMDFVPLTRPRCLFACLKAMGRNVVSSVTMNWQPIHQKTAPCVAPAQRRYEAPTTVAPWCVHMSQGILNS